MDIIEKSDLTKSSNSSWSSTNNNIYLIILEISDGHFSIGSGFFAHGYIMTCFHVVKYNPNKTRVFNKDRQEIAIDFDGSKFYPERDLFFIKPTCLTGGGLILNLNISIPNGMVIYTGGYSSVGAEHLSSSQPFPITQLGGTIEGHGVHIGKNELTRDMVKIWIKSRAWPLGVSGSPVFDSNNEVIGMAHYGFYQQEAIELKNVILAIHSYELWSVLYDLGVITR